MSILSLAKIFLCTKLFSIHLLEKLILGTRYLWLFWIRFHSAILLLWMSSFLCNQIYNHFVVVNSLFAERYVTHLATRHLGFLPYCISFSLWGFFWLQHFSRWPFFNRNHTAGVFLLEISLDVSLLKLSTNVLWYLSLNTIRLVSPSDRSIILTNFLVCSFIWHIPHNCYYLRICIILRSLPTDNKYLALIAAAIRLIVCSKSIDGDVAASCHKTVVTPLITNLSM